MSYKFIYLISFYKLFPFYLILHTFLIVHHPCLPVPSYLPNHPTSLSNPQNQTKLTQKSKQ